MRSGPKDTGTRLRRGCEANSVGYILGLGINAVLKATVRDLTEDAALARLDLEDKAAKVRRYGAKSWHCERRVIARIEVSPLGADCRFAVTNLNGTPRALYEREYCQRGQMENLIKAHKLHLASDRTSCTKATANQFRLLVHTAAYWLLHTLRELAPKTSFWRKAQFDIIRCNLIKVAGRVEETATRIGIALPTNFPYPDSLRLLSGRVAKLPP